jgi:hypothetical protein
MLNRTGSAQGSGTGKGQADLPVAIGDQPPPPIVTDINALNVVAVADSG